MLNIKIDASQLRIEGRRIGKMVNEFPREITNAINKSLKVGKTEAQAKIQSIYNVKGVNLTIHPGGMSGSIGASGGMLPVSSMSPQVNGKTISVEIIRGSRKVIGISGKGKGAFMTGDGRIMERRQPSQYPIFPVSTIGIPQMLGSKKVSEPVREKMEEVLVEQLAKSIFGKV
jgi:hypothetical protein